MSKPCHSRPPEADKLRRESRIAAGTGQIILTIFNNYID
jgi:hypothetical protein